MWRPDPGGTSYPHPLRGARLGHLPVGTLPDINKALNCYAFSD
jgi:hypothetical protein